MCVCDYGMCCDKEVEECEGTLIAGSGDRLYRHFVVLRQWTLVMICL